MTRDPYAHMASMVTARQAQRQHANRASCRFCRSVFTASAVPAHVLAKHKDELAVRRWAVVVR